MNKVHSKSKWSMSLWVLVFAAVLLSVVTVGGAFVSRSPIRSVRMLSARRSLSRRPLQTLQSSSADRLLFRGGGSGRVVNIESLDQFDSEIKAAEGKLIVIDFFATWCLPCQAISPVLDEISKSDAMKGVSFLKIDVDKFPDVTEKFQVMAMPTFIFLKGGEIVDRLSGASKQLLMNTINTHK